MDESTGWVLPPSLGYRLYTLVTALVMIVAGLLVQVIHCPRWAPWCRFTVTVVLVVVVVLVFRALPTYLAAGQLLR